jgi:hypothetical protein
MTTSRFRVDARDRENRSLEAARRALRLPRRKPTDADRPFGSTFGGRKHPVIPGQLALGEEHVDRQDQQAAA